ncbi:Probable inactive purple acid phosphatase 27 [Geodia barretti]|nr:Probable inactive purple acid phosphatase 27 [Geodia barretti]
MCGSPAIDFGYRDPGLLHKAKLSGLQPGLTYYYTCGDQQFGWSQEFSFRAATPANASATTRVVVYGDMGNGHVDGTWQVIREQPGAVNTSRMLRGLVNQTDVVFHIGDISYARGFANVWDEFFDEVQAVCGNVPYMVCIGNHERNWNEPTSYWKSPDSMGECGVPYERRFPMPRPALDQPWYNIDYGSVHYLVMSTEHNFTKGLHSVPVSGE